MDFQLGPYYPAGTSVAAYAYANRINDAAPSGLPVAMAVADDTGVLFLGLPEGASYSAYAFVGTHRYVDFTIPPPSPYIPGPVGPQGPGVERENLDLVRTRSLGFMRQMLLPLAGVVGDDEIHLDRLYPYEYTGPVGGRLGLRQPEPPTHESSYITVGNPIQPVPNAFGGTFFGAVTADPALGDLAQYRVRLMKHVDIDYDTVPPVTQALDSAGYFGLDAPDNAGSNEQNGSWRIRLERVSDDTQVGGTWPSMPVYDDLDVELHVYTDSDDLVAAQPARRDGIFQFDYSTPGRKRAQLVRRSTGEILADDSPALGTIRSYRVVPGEPAYGTNFVYQTYTYDQAVALCAVLAAGEEEMARDMVGGLLALQVNSGASDGGFRFSGQQLAPTFGDQAFRTGGHACALLALLRYMNACPEDLSRPYLDAAQRALDYIETLRSTSGMTDGMILGGTGAYTGPGQVFDPSTSLTWASTEHHLDLYHAYNEAVRLGLDYTTERDQIRDILLGPLWDETNGRFYQGMQSTGPDPADALDLHSWGAMFLYVVGATDRMNAILTPDMLEPFKWRTPTGIVGYNAAYNGPGYEGMIPNVWSEGTLSLAYTFARIGDTARWRDTIEGILPGQEADGSWRYVWRADPSNDMTTSHCSISTAWATLAQLGYGIW
jgi:hypothetical protein